MNEQDPTESPEPFAIPPAEYVDEAGHGPDGKVRIGEGDSVVEMDLSRTGAGQDGDAARHPLGETEYWRAAMVGKYPIGSEGRPMTDEEYVNLRDDVEWGDDG